MPTDTASASSLLRPCPVESSRTRAASLAGTSTTSMPSPRSRAVNGLPRPVAPSIAQASTTVLADGCQAVGVSASWGRVRNTRRNLPIWISSPLASATDSTGLRLT